MEGKTHRAGGVAFMMVGFEVMRHKGLLLPEVSPLLQLAVMYPVSQYASTIPDLDHHWGSVGGKSPVNWVLHKVLHLSKPKHRSWQTHSVLVTGGFLLLLATFVHVGNLIWDGASAIDWVIMRLLVIGFILGLSSHLFLDLINPSGIHLIPYMKIRLVPRTPFFATGGTWEKKIIYPLMLIIGVVAAINSILSLFDTSILAMVGELTNSKG